MSSDVKISNHDSSDGPSVVSYGGVLHVVHRGNDDNKLWYTQGTNDGESWSTDWLVNAPGVVRSGYRPGFTAWRHSTGTRDQLLMVYRGLKA